MFILSGVYIARHVTNGDFKQLDCITFAGGITNGIFI